MGINWRALLLTLFLLLINVALLGGFPYRVGPLRAAPLMDGTAADHDSPLAIGDTREEQVVRVYFDDLATAHRIAISMEPAEALYERGYLVITATPSEMTRLREAGLTVVVDEQRARQYHLWQRARGADGTTSIPGFACYRTVEELHATAEALATTYPQLAAWHDVGDSWQKTQDLGGYDLGVLVLSNSAVPGPKPKVFITASIHAREYTPAELVTRLAEHLLDQYDKDADITWILDYHEIHLMLMANPDGRKVAEQGWWWRKNTNETYCAAARDGRGADLNRNFPTNWGCCGGSSGDECSEVFRGRGPASEPETQAIVNYLRANFTDGRGPAPDDAAPADTMGIYLDIHSSGRLLLWPWGHTDQPAPNATALQTLGRKLAFFNGHMPVQAIGLYPTDGTTTGFSYGELGLASYTYELGTSFFESCAYFEETLTADNMPSLLYALKVARAPYRTPAGPDVSSLAVDVGSTPPGAPAGTMLVVTAVIDDSRYSAENGQESTQIVESASYFVDGPPWDGGRAVAMRASDGSFDAVIETVTAEIDTMELLPGRHTLFVQGKDTAGNAGAVSALHFYVSKEEPLPRVYRQFLSFLSDGREP